MIQPFLIPLGAVVAAVVAGMFSYLALIISKEQKTSEFRQAWIDSLRIEMAEFISSVRILRFNIDTLKAQHGGAIPAEKLKSATCGPYETAIVSYSRILLRLNPDNLTSAALINALQVTQEALKAGNYEAATDNLKNARDCARVVLKEEWERVKNGERVFTWSKRILAALVLGGLVSLLVALLFSVVSRVTPIESKPTREITPATVTPGDGKNT